MAKSIYDTFCILGAVNLGRQSGEFPIFVRAEYNISVMCDCGDSL